MRPIYIEKMYFGTDELGAERVHRLAPVSLGIFSLTWTHKEKLGIKLTNA